MQRPLAVFVDGHAVAQQIVVQQPRKCTDPAHVRLALQNQAHIHATPGGVAQLPHQSITREEIRVGNHDALLCTTKSLQVVGFDIGTAQPVVAFDQHGAAGPGRLGYRAYRAGWLQHRRHQALAGSMHLRYHRAGDLHRIILLGHGTKVAKMIGAVVDTADKCPLTVDYHDLAVQAPEQVGAHAHQPGLWVESVKAHAGIGHGRNEFGGQVGSAVAIHRYLHPHTALGSVDQHLL